MLCTAHVMSLNTSTDRKLDFKHIKTTQHLLQQKKPSTVGSYQTPRTHPHPQTFEFNSKFYNQLTGTAMGTNVAPSYTNATMTSIENYIFKTSNNKKLTWKQYIDDMFFSMDRYPSFTFTISRTLT